VAALPLGALGVGLRPVHYPALGGELPANLHYFEVIAENFLTGSAPARWNLHRARERLPIVVHGLSLNLLGPEPPDRAHVQALARLADELDSPFVTDHLCFTAAHGRSSHDLLPVPPTRALVKVAAARARMVQDVLQRPFGLENLSPLGRFPGELSHGAFWLDVVAEAGCHVLLDVNNLAVARANAGHDPAEVLDHLSPAQVLQVHVAGHHRRPDRLRIDTHDAPVPDEVVALYQQAWAALGPFPTLLEWDDRIPDLPALATELHRVTADRGAPTTVRRPLPPRPAPAGDPAAPAPTATVAFQRGMLAALSTPLRWTPPQPSTGGFDAALLAGVPNARVLAAYQEQYWMRLSAALQRRFPTATALLGAWEANRLGSAFHAAHPPAGRDLGALGDGLLDFVAGTEWDLPGVREALALDQCVSQVFEHPPVTPWVPGPADRDGVAARRLRASPVMRRLHLTFPLPPVRDRALTAPSEAPVPCPPEDPATWLVFRTPALDVVTLRVDPALAALLQALDEAPLGDALARVGDDVDPGQVRTWFQAGVRFGWWCAEPGPPASSTPSSRA
jgi:uncharacterized protein (UPF0276 family)